MFCAEQLGQRTGSSRPLDPYTRQSYRRGTRMLAIDADSHFVEPLDLFERRIDARFRDRAYKVEKDPTTGKRQLVVDNKPLRLLDAEELLSAISGYGQKESGEDRKR